MSSSPSTSPVRRNSYEQDDDLSFLEKFRYINGRRFHNEESTVNYYVPNDSEESSRLNLQHYLLRCIWNGNFSSPITEILSKRNASVLDIGCCAGTWVLDMAQKYPQSSFIGIDISRMYPSSDKTPLNVIFLQHNILEGLPWPPNTFDFVYKRFLSLSFTLKDLTKMVNEITRVTKIGGWIEVMNYGNSMKNSGKATKKLMDALKEFHESKHIFVLNIKESVKMLEDTGSITNIKYEENYTPIGKWNGQIGDLMMSIFMSAFNSYKLFLAPFMNITIEQFDVLLSEMEKEFNDHQSYVHTYRVYGKKSFEICDI
ncbi:hypothetical protein RclHR1_03210006 [Rhizophagus clarus]|uniref:S-adenosyl-L-methionine-dependent methyltransferase n=1 Tax=Rhizophagus clarus TaxID=94130 RepID=A0A2Z6R870_9GLOM|nr:hypothetical protein RclHR1_03210006 [Rhizophagus clarus]GES79763.1 S-adenosyl-L-methionine-dependent methyltransferase [Rhizophagus clarus]